MIKEWPSHSEVLDEMSNQEKISILKESLMDINNEHIVKEFNMYKDDMFSDSDFSEIEKSTMSKEYADELTFDWIVDGGVIDSLIEDSDELQSYIESNYDYEMVVDTDAAYDQWKDEQMGL